MEHEHGASTPAAALFPTAIKEALAGLALQHGRPHDQWQALPSAKPLIRRIAPGAVVKREMSPSAHYVALVDGRPVHCRHMHTTPDQAWRCIANFLFKRLARRNDAS